MLKKLFVLKALAFALLSSSIVLASNIDSEEDSLRQSFSNFFSKIDNIEDKLRIQFNETHGPSVEVISVEGDDPFTFDFFQPILNENTPFAYEGIELDMSGSIGLIRYMSYTLPTDDPLNYNAQGGVSQEVEGYLFLPNGEEPEGGFPLSVVIHGSYGVNDGHLYLARELMESGRAVFVPRTYFSRNAFETAFDQASMSPMSQLKDIILGIDKISSHLPVRRDDITMIGFSRGG